MEGSGASPDGRSLLMFIVQDKNNPYRKDSFMGEVPIVNIESRQLQSRGHKDLCDYSRIVHNW